jgi:predicted esterase
MTRHALLAVTAGCLILPTGAARDDEPDDIKDVKSQDLRAGKDSQKRYFLIDPPKDAKAPAAGFGLIVVMPGGPGTADFHPFVKRIFKNSVPPGYLVAQPVAVKWNAKQEIVWPTARDKDQRIEGQKFTTEEFVGAVIDDVDARHKLDPARVFTLSWSSSGPAAYAVSLSNPKVRGSFVAMSVFKPDRLPPLGGARGHAYFVYHSPDDRVCPYRMAKQAAEDLPKNGATVTLKEYDGGHGWRAGLYDDIREGITWLEKNSTAPKQP